MRFYQLLPARKLSTAIGCRSQFFRNRLNMTVRHQSRSGNTVLYSYESTGLPGDFRIITYTGVGGLSVFSTLAYTGMRAQNDGENTIGRLAAFWMGFPYTLLVFLFVEEGSCKAFGVHLPRNEEKRH